MPLGSVGAVDGVCLPPIALPRTDSFQYRELIQGKHFTLSHDRGDWLYRLVEEI
ncbi:hypothetical protein TUMEXPCC7403_21390 [Tumidithrix helvetica PCC 7403]